MKQVMLYGFACVDASLYLDTHPDDAEALAYFKEHDRIYREAVEEYSRNYGPLTRGPGSRKEGVREYV